MMKTQQREDITDALRKAVVDSVLPDGDVATSKEKAVKKRAASPKNGVVPPPTGRPLGVRNKLTNLRDAVLQAFDQVGGAQYLVRLAEGTQSDRAAFTGLVAKVLPTQINQNVEGGIKLELSWLAGRSIGTTTAQVEEVQSKVIDLERDAKGKYRIKDPVDAPDSVKRNYRNYESPAGEGADGTADAGSRPMPPTAQKAAGGDGDV